jgi:hypothetical protein
VNEALDVPSFTVTVTGVGVVTEPAVASNNALADPAPTATVLGTDRAAFDAATASVAPPEGAAGLIRT